MTRLTNQTVSLVSTGLKLVNVGIRADFIVKPVSENSSKSSELCSHCMSNVAVRFKHG